MQTKMKKRSRVAAWIAVGVAAMAGVWVGVEGTDRVFAQVGGADPKRDVVTVRAADGASADGADSDGAKGQSGARVGDEVRGAGVKKDAAAEAAKEGPVVVAPAALDHGWVAVRDHGQSITHVVHLPPRGVGKEGVPGRVSMGVARMVAGTPQVTDRVGSWGFEGEGSRVVVVMQEGAGLESSRIRRVLGLSAVPLGARVWEYPPGRLEVLASLPGGVEVMGVAGSALGPVVMVRGRGDAAEGDSRAMCLVQNEWLDVEIPEEARRGSAWVLRWGDGGSGGAGARDEGAVAILVPPAARDGGEKSDVAGEARAGAMWIGRLRVERTERVEGKDGDVVTPARSLVRAEWSARRVPWPESFYISGDAAEMKAPAMEPDAVLVVDEAGGGFAVGAGGVGSGRERVVALTWLGAAKKAISMVELREQGPVMIGRVEGVARDAGVTAVGRSGGASGLAFVWMGQEDGTIDAAAAAPGAPVVAPVAAKRGAAAPAPRMMVCEVSLSGQELFRGPALLADGRFKKEVESLAVLLLMVMVAVVLFVVRADVPSQLLLPEGVELADPARRLVGALIDYVPAALLAAWLRGTPIGQTLMPIPFMSTGYDPGTILIAMGVAWGHTTVCEWLLGRSIGKMLTGTWVMSVDSARKANKRTGAEEVEEGMGMRGRSAAAKGNVLGVTERVGLWGCAVRNFVRWVAPVLGMFVLVDPSRRHPGDMAGRTVVVQARGEEEEEAN